MYSNVLECMPSARPLCHNRFLIATYSHLNLNETAILCHTFAIAWAGSTLSSIYLASYEQDL